MVERLSISEFERLLSRGRGKVILHLQQYDAAPYRDAIRRCCLTNTAYDPQIEGVRETYLMQVIKLSNDEILSVGPRFRHFSQQTIFAGGILSACLHCWVSLRKEDFKPRVRPSIHGVASITILKTHPQERSIRC